MIGERTTQFQPTALFNPTLPKRRAPWPTVGGRGPDREDAIIAALIMHGYVTQGWLLRELFQRNVSAAELRGDLERLEAAGIIRRVRVTGTGGRPAMVWGLRALMYDRSDDRSDDRSMTTEGGQHGA